MGVRYVNGRVTPRKDYERSTQGKYGTLRPIPEGGRMKYLLSIIMVICLFPWTAEAGVPGKVKSVMKSTVLLVDKDSEPYCSGFIAEDRKGVSHVWTALHCCSAGVQEVSGKKYVTYMYRNARHTSSIVHVSDGDSNGTDICRLPGTANRHTTDLRIGDIRWIKYPNDGTLQDRELWAVQPYFDEAIITVKGTTIDLKGDAIHYSRLWRITPDDLNFRMTWVSGIILPGMSGSPVVDNRGVVLGVVSRWYGDAIFPVGGIAMFNTTNLD